MQVLVFAALAGGTCTVTRMLAAPVGAQPVARCVAPVAGIGGDLSDTDLEALEMSGFSDGRPPPRKPLRDLTLEEWRDFRDALAIYRKRDAEAFLPANGYLALTAFHGIPAGLKPRLPQSPAGAQVCTCNHKADMTEEYADDPDQASLFLLWHRAYIHAFELSIRSIMRDELRIDPSDPDALRRRAAFRLPYWDWSSNSTEHRRADLEAIRRWFLRNDSPSSPYLSADESLAALSREKKDRFLNPFYEPSRSADFAAGSSSEIFSTGETFRLKAQINPFNVGGTGGFNAFQTYLESNWHQLVHSAVGSGSGGPVMGATEYAAEDPLFWVHHANVDRLWMVWASKNPTAPMPDYSRAWYEASVRFPVRVGGRARTYRPRYQSLAVASGEAALSYRYADLSYYSGGAGSRVKTADISGSISLKPCPNGDPKLFCIPSRRSSTTVLGTNREIQIPPTGTVVSFPLSNANRDRIFEAIDKPVTPKESFFIGIRLTEEAVIKVREGPGIEAFQIFVGLRGLQPSNCPMTVLTEEHYLGTMNLFDAKGAWLNAEDQWWQYHSMDGAPSREFVFKCLRDYPNEKWIFQIFIVPVFRGEAPKDAQPLITMDALGIAIRPIARAARSH